MREYLLDMQSTLVHVLGVVLEEVFNVLLVLLPLLLALGLLLWSLCCRAVLLYRLRVHSSNQVIDRRLPLLTLLLGEFRLVIRFVLRAPDVQVGFVLAQELMDSQHVVRRYQLLLVPFLFQDFLFLIWFTVP